MELRRRVGLLLFLSLTVILTFSIGPKKAADQPAWVAALNQRVAEIDARTEGNLGVFVKRLRDDSQLNYQAERNWYLASTTKVPVAIVLLRLQERGKVSLATELTLHDSDYVDGGGDLLSTKPGTRFSVQALLGKMITESDSTAADLLIRLISEQELNRQVHEELALRGFGPLTSLLEVRYSAYEELHPDARRLSNQDFIALRKVPDRKARRSAFAAKLGLAEGALKVPSLEEAFERYYQRGFNSATLVAFGELLERLVRGAVLSVENTKLLLGLMENSKTGAKRIEAGLPPRLRFAQKTGTQLGRICNIGIIRGEGEAADAVVVTACVEKFKEQAVAESALKDLGAALGRSGVFERR